MLMSGGAQLSDWVSDHQAAVWWLAASSAVMFVASVIAVPMLLVRMPSDYFARDRLVRERWGGVHPVARAALIAGKNLVGVLLVVSGIIMLVLPGQGLLALVAGIMLLDFPARRRLERWIVSLPRVRMSIDWLRRRSGRPPLALDPANESTAR